MGLFIASPSIQSSGRFHIGQNVIFTGRGPHQGKQLKISDIKETLSEGTVLTLGHQDNDSLFGYISGPELDLIQPQPTLNEIMKENGRPIGRKPSSRSGKPKLTKDQKAALDRYNFCMREEDRLGGSVFANAHNMRAAEAKTQAAYAECLRLGMTHEHGL